jgi:hypothetical protein
MNNGSNNQVGSAAAAALVVSFPRLSALQELIVRSVFPDN